MEIGESSVGSYPCLVAGGGPPLVMLAGLSPDTGIAPGLMRATHERALRPWTNVRTVHYINRRPGLPRGITLSQLAGEIAAGMQQAFAEPVDLLGSSTGGSIAQQLAAEHPGVVRRLVLLSTACRLGPEAARLQRQIAARVRAGAPRQAAAVMGAALVPRPLGLPAGLLAAWLAHRFSPAQFADLAATIEAEDTFDLAELPVITARTLLVAGGRDRFYPQALFAETAALIADARLELHPRRGHITVTASPKAIAQVNGFLAH